MNVPHETWLAIRYVNWGILAAAWLVMLYRGVFYWVQFRKSFSWSRFMNLIWTTLAIYSIGEVLYQDTEGGPRVVMQTLVAFLQLWIVMFKFGVDDDLQVRELPLKLNGLK